MLSPFRSNSADVNTRQANSGSSLTANELGTAWQTAQWRHGAHPFRYYNFDALDRVVKETDLTALAKKWLLQSQQAATDPDGFFDVTYQYLIFLGDARIKNRIPVGGGGAERPFANFLSLMLEAKQNGTDVRGGVSLIKTFLKRFVHPDLGLEMSKRDGALDFANDQILPYMHTLAMVRAFKF